MKYTKLTVMPDVSCSGIWTKGTNYMVEFEDLNLPEELVKEFEAWVDFYDDKCHETRHFRFKPGMADELNKRGRDLAKKLKKALPDVQILYRGEIEGDMLPEEEITLS